MNEERMMLQGQLAEAERARRTLEKAADGQVLIIRMRSLPTLPIDRLQTEEILSAATALHQIKAQADEQRALIARLKDALGQA